MAELVRDYHDNLQTGNRDEKSQEELELRISIILDKIPNAQMLMDPDTSTLSRNITKDQVQKALHITKHKSATGLDGCPYELWKTLNMHHTKAQHSNAASFDIIKTLTKVINNI